MSSAAETAEVAESILKITPAALDAVLAARADEPNPDELALFVDVNGIANGAYTYDMWFEAPRDAASDDAVEDHGGIVVVVLASAKDRLHGSTLDAGEDGLAIVNPNSPPVVARPEMIRESELSDPLEIAILELLEAEINPQIAQHGGRADLVAVKDAVAYLRLSGGCQGCGLAAVTLSQGITVAIKEAVPQIVDVVDVTDHETGESPYYTGAKK